MSYVCDQNERRIVAIQVILISKANLQIGKDYTGILFTKSYTPTCSTGTLVRFEAQTSNSLVRSNMLLCRTLLLSKQTFSSTRLIAQCMSQ